MTMTPRTARQHLVQMASEPTAPAQLRMYHYIETGKQFDEDAFCGTPLDVAMAVLGVVLRHSYEEALLVGHADTAAILAALKGLP